MTKFLQGVRKQKTLFFTQIFLKSIQKAIYNTSSTVYSKELAMLTLFSILTWSKYLVISFFQNSPYLLKKEQYV